MAGVEASWADAGGGCPAAITDKGGPAMRTTTWRGASGRTLTGKRVLPAMNRIRPWNTMDRI
jgi:hypothetical protein